MPQPTLQGAPKMASYSILAGLTVLIPIPFAGTPVKNFIQRRLVRELAAEHALGLDEAAVSALGDDPSPNLGRALVQKVVFYPAKFFLRRALFLLTGADVVDSSSECFHRAYLIGAAMDRRLLAPAGPHDAAQVRAAIDETCKAVDARPIKAAVAGALRRGVESAALRRALPKILRSMLRVDSESDDHLRRAAEERVVTELASDALSDLFSKPGDHLAESVGRFEAALNRKR